MTRHTVSVRAVSASLLGLAALGAPSQAAIFSDVNLGLAGPGGLNLTAFVTCPTVFSASNSGTLFTGNVGLSNGASTNVSGGGTITGNLYLDPGATLQANFASQFHVNGSITTQSLAQAVLDVQAAAANAASLTPDQSFGAVGSAALTILATGALNGSGGRDTVVSIGSVNITNPSNNLTINGGANDFFIINVGSVTVSNGQVALSGGIDPSHVLFNVLGTGDVTMSNGSSVLNGTFLAPNTGQEIRLTPGTVNGAIIGCTISTSSGPHINGNPFVPAPGSVLLVGAAGSLALVRRRR